MTRSPFAVVWLGAAAVIFIISGANLEGRPHFSRGAESATKFGVHEIRLACRLTRGNPFDAVIRVAFIPPSGAGAAKTVEAFYDGDNTWVARAYISEAGTWHWTVEGATDVEFAARAGEFRAEKSTLRGRLLPHARNPRQWQTEDGRWFLNVSDTAYFLFSPRDTMSREITFDDFVTYVRHAQAQGVTSLRSWLVFGRDGLWAEDTPVRWTDGYFADEAGEYLQVKNFRRTDERLIWLLDHAPDIYLQLILLPRGSLWGKDEEAWHFFTEAVKIRVLRYILARYAAFPQVFWLAVNDAHYGEKFPRHNALAREVGEFFRRYDPWNHPYSSGPARQHDVPFAHEPWIGYIHLERRNDLAARALPLYVDARKPIFNGEDQYEQDRVRTDPVDMAYFQRRLYWAWLFSGGSANYGGRWNVLHAYRATAGQAYERPRRQPPDIIYTAALKGLDTIPHFTNYFDARRLDLGDFEPDPSRVSVPDGHTPEGEAKLMRRSMNEWLVYHPNAAADGKSARVDRARTARIRLDMTEARGSYRIEWCRVEDGYALSDGIVEGGDYRLFISPWQGHDVVLWLKSTE